MKRLFSALRRIHRGERGITGLETAIILIAFVVVATVFAFVVLTTGIFSSERGKETVFAGLEKARGTMEVRGGVVVTAENCPGPLCAAEQIFFSVANTAGGESIPMDPLAERNRTVIAYRDDTVTDNNVPYTADDIIGDGDTLLEPGEVKLVLIEVDDIDPAASMDPNDRFTLEVQTPVGAVLDITRQLPAELATVMQLH